MISLRSTILFAHSTWPQARLMDFKLDAIATASLRPRPRCLRPENFHARREEFDAESRRVEMRWPPYSENSPQPYNFFVPVPARPFSSPAPLSLRARANSTRARPPELRTVPPQGCWR